MRDALAQSLANRNVRILGQLASEVEATVSRPASAALGPPPRVTFAGERTPGPWLGYLFAPRRSRCWLALGWQPTDGASAVRRSVLMDLGSDLGSARIGAVPGPWEEFASIVLSVEYPTDALPSEHNLINDLHAMVMLHDLLL